MYFGMIGITAIISFFLFDFYLRGLQIGGLSDLWDIGFRVKIISLISLPVMSLMVLIPAQVLCVEEILFIKKPRNKNARFRPLTLFLSLAIILTFALVFLYIFLG